MEVYDNVLELIGNTPMVRLHEMNRGLKPTLLGKLEMFNPGNSVKDRIGIRMIRAAEEEGLLQTGGTIVEPTSGNTGTGLAIAAAILGYKCVFVMPDKVSQEKISLLKAYGAEVVTTPYRRGPRKPRKLLQRGRPPHSRNPRCFPAQPVFQSGQPPDPLRNHRPRDMAATRRQNRCLRRRRGHRRHDLGHRPLSQRAEPQRLDRRAPTLKAPSTPGELARPYKVEGIGEDFMPGTLDVPHGRQWVTVCDRDFVRNSAPDHPRRRHPHRRLGWHGYVGGVAGCANDGRRQDCCGPPARHRAGLPL